MLAPVIRILSSLSLAACAVLFLGALGAAEGARATAAEVDVTADEAAIRRLVDQLGAPQFAAREKAQAELQRLGLSAFDFLYEAQQHDDIEISLRARFLVKALQSAWASQWDSLDVRRILTDYGSENEAGRRSRLEQLLRLDNQQGIKPICQLVRYEASPALSKHAALMVMRLPQPDDKAGRDALVRTIATAVGGSKRPASAWLRTYSRTLAEADSTLDSWEQLCAEELSTFGEQPEHSAREIARELLRWYAELLHQRGQHERVSRVAQQTFDLHDGTPRQLVDTAGWLMKNGWWSLMDELAERFSHDFKSRASLLYYLAESQSKRGLTEVAEQTVEQALKLDPEQPRVHRILAYELQERGLLNWAEREYRCTLELVDVGSEDDMVARSLLSEMLHDSGKDQAAATALEPLIEAMDRDESIGKRFAQTFGREPNSFRSRFHYFRAQEYANSNPQEHWKHLQAGIQADPTDADVLIGLYRAPGQNEEAKESVREKIEEAAGAFREEIEDYSRKLEQSQARNETDYVAYYERILANSCNQLAWLISNTEGDFDEAVRCSHRSLELRPEEPASYLDTLGRCYFAKGDLENAIKHQSRAAALQPHSGLIRRQLELFQNLRSTPQGGAAPADPNGGK